MKEEISDQPEPNRTQGALEEEAFDEATENAFSLRKREVDAPVGRARLAYVVCEPLEEAVVKGTGERLRAVLMTALLASLGLLPAALSHAIGSETQRPIAMVVVSGTISAALLTLVILPVTYYWAGRARQWWHQRRSPLGSLAAEDVPGDDDALNL